MTKVSESMTVTPVQARKALLSAFKTKRPVFLWGPPGIGKSEVVAETAHELGGTVIDLRMSQLDPTDIRGIPFFNQDLGKMDWAPPIDLPDEEFAKKHPIIVLFLDEMNSAPPAVQASGYQLVLNRRVGKYVLPDNVVIVAAGNRESDKGVTYRMPMPLANRFVHLEMRADFPSWQTWAVQNGVHRDVVGYLSYFKNDMYDFDAKASSRAYATPRSWVFVSDILKDDTSDNDTRFTLIAGAVGEGLATKFAAHQRTNGKLPNPLDVLNGKVKTLEIKEISAMYSLTVSMCYELKDAADHKRVDSKQLHAMADNFFEFMMENFETEVAVMGCRVALKTYQLPIEAAKLKKYLEFNSRYGKYITAAHKS